MVYAVLVAVTLALLGWALHRQLEGFLITNTVERLDRITRPILVRTVPPRGYRDGPPISPVAGTEGSALEQAADELLRQLSRSRSDVAVAVLDAQGEIIKSALPSSSADAVQIANIPAEWAGAIEEGTLVQTVQWVAPDPGGGRQLVVLTPLTLRSNDGTPDIPLYLEQVTSLASADEVLNELRVYILLGIVVGTAIGVIACLALTRAILRPLERMVVTAEAISGGDLDRRLRLPAGSNEVARLGSAFDHMVDRLGAALEAQRRFVADASHELRTPLTSLEGLSEMLLIGADRGDTSVVQRTVRSMHSELGRLGRLVADLLTLSRLDSTTPVKHIPLDAGKLVWEVAEQMRPLAEARSVRMWVEAPGPALVEGEPDRLKQVMLNLVDNALRYTPPEGEVRLSAVADPAIARVRLEVRDTGPGIAPQDLPHIFDRFYRSDTSRNRATGNTGLGLAIARAIVEAHGGTISAQSRPGEGATFRIELPANHSQNAREDRAPLLTRRVGERGAAEHKTPEGVA
jgi:two-component system OmpR family sensor kinase